MAPPPHLLTDLQTACLAIDKVLESDWIDGIITYSKEMVENALEPVRKYLDAAFWAYTKDQISGVVVGDISGSLLELFLEYERVYTRFSYYTKCVTYESVLDTRQRIAERAVRMAEVPEEEPEDEYEPDYPEYDDGLSDHSDDDEPVSCGRNCGDCGGLRYGCGLTRRDIRRYDQHPWTPPVPRRDDREASLEPSEPAPEPLTGGGAGSEPEPATRSHWVITASCAQFGDCTEYFQCQTDTREEALGQIRMACRDIRWKAPEWKRAEYDKLFWDGEASPEATPRQSLFGAYRSYCRIENIGDTVHPVSTDDTYSLGMVSHSNLESWRFTLRLLTEDSEEHKRVLSLPSIWSRVLRDDDDDDSEDTLDSALEEAERFADY